MLATACESIFHLHFEVSLVSGTSRKDQIVEKENCWILFHVRINENIQIHSSNEKLHCDESHLPGTYRRELPVQMLPSMQDADQQLLPSLASHRMKHLLSPPFHYCSKHFLPTNQQYRKCLCFHQ